MKHLRGKFKPVPGVTDISPAEFQSAVLEAELPVLVDFYSPSCAPCNRLAPVLAAAARTFNGRLLVRKMNTQKHDTIDLRYTYGGPSSAIPALMFFHKGKVIHVHRGFLPMGELVDLFDMVLDSIATGQT